MTGSSDLARWDWLMTEVGTVLHALAVPDIEPDDWTWWYECELLCGRVATVHVPSWSDRMGAVRCRTCSKRCGYPPGVGSPKNDPAIRPLLGLPTTEETA